MSPDVWLVFMYTCTYIVSMYLSIHNVHRHSVYDYVDE